MNLRPAVGAHYGLVDWVLLLLTAVVMIVALLVLLIMALVFAPNSHESLRAFVAWEPARLTLMLFILALAWHAWVGGRSVLMDYIPNDSLRLLKSVALFCYLVICVLWAASVLWSV